MASKNSKIITQEGEGHNSTPTFVKNISTNQKEILFNVMQLYNNGNPFDCDITASTLKFYEQKSTDKYVIPEPRLLFDVYPQNEKIKQITPFRKIPLENNSIHSVVFDPPFVISPKTAPSMLREPDNNNLIARRFSSFYPAMEMYYNYYWWIKECYRILDENGLLVFKTMSTVSGGYQHNTEEFSYMAALNAGFYCVDKFYLEAKARLISTSKIKKQCHARKYTSVFYVFQKNSKMMEKFNYFKLLETMSRQNLEGMTWKIK